MIYGLETNIELPDGWMPLEGVAVVKCLNETGDVSLLLANTNGVSAWEILGMLTAAIRSTEDDMTFVGIDDDDDDLSGD